MLSVLWQVIILPLPWTVRRHLIELIPGFELAPSARIGLSILGAKRVRLGDGTIVGHLTVVKGLTELCLGEHARVGNLNWITAVSEQVERHFVEVPDRDPSLRLGRHAAITHRHMVDCTGGVEIGAYAIVGGWRSQLISHGIAFREPRQDAAPITVGHHAFVGSNCVLVKGSVVPDRSIVGAGSVFDASDEQPLGLFRGNPAIRVAELNPDLGYFHRATGFIE